MLVQVVGDDQDVLDAAAEPIKFIFTAVAPVEAGNANDYAYPTDPINMFNWDGRFEWGTC